MKIIWLVLGMVAAIGLYLIFLKKQLLTKFFSSNSGNQGAFRLVEIFSRIEKPKIRDLLNQSERIQGATGAICKKKEKVSSSFL
jgi:hypothetical protein